MGTKSPGPQRCRVILQQCLAIQLCKPGHTPDDFWMYDSGYMIFQNFLAANSQCWWNAPLTSATKALRYAGHVAPGMLLVTAEPCALEVLRGAYARSVLKPPATYIIKSVGDIDDCYVTPTAQCHFTPLTEALCDVIMDLTLIGQSATIENVKVKLTLRFPHMESPSVEMMYDALAQLMQEGKIYQTAKGYFIVTPERRRSRSHSHSRNNRSFDDNNFNEPLVMKTMLMSNSEALHNLYGEISTERDGDLTHQCIQTNLADVICGGNPNDKILYPKNSKRRSASFPTPRSLERRHSLRLFGSSKRLQRCTSTRSLSKNFAQTLLGTDSSSTEYHSTDSCSPKKPSLLSRLFRRSGRSKQRKLETYSAQFPPVEWFNSRAVHLHSVGTQTIERDIPVAHTLSNSTFYDGSEISQRSSTLPRRHHRRHLSSESTFLISSRDCSPIRRRSPVYCSASLPRLINSIHPTNQNKNFTSNSPAHVINTNNKQILNERNSRITLAKTNEIRGNSVRINDKIYRNVQSGPSSLESGKGSITTTSTGPSSIDSGKILSQTCQHSSLESHFPSIPVKSPNRSMIVNTSPIHSINSTSSPMKRQSQLTKVNLSENTSHTQNKINSSPQRQQQNFNTPNSKSNSSITLQVTTNSVSASSQLNHPSTKIYVQNSPVHSVITLENGKLTENSNFFIINNETTNNGDIINRTLTKQNSTPTRTSTSSASNLSRKSSHRHSNDRENIYYNENDAVSQTTCDDSISIVSEISPDSSLASNNIYNNEENNSSTKNDINRIESTKFTKNINNDATMNNSRKLALQIPNHQNVNKSTCNNQTTGNNIIYNNVLKTDSSSPTSPINNKNVDLFNQNHNIINSINIENQLAGSVGSLRFADNRNKTSNYDLKNLAYHHTTNQYNQNHDVNLMKNEKKLNSNPSINSVDSIAHILHKNIATVGSEPNLISLNKNNIETTKIINNGKMLDTKIATKDLRRLSLTKERNNQQQFNIVPTSNDVYSFPSLTDLSFNFTSMTAQKILQGVSINSIDTLVELNLANTQTTNSANGKPQEKQQNNISTICTDYGMV